MNKVDSKLKTRVSMRTRAAHDKKMKTNVYSNCAMSLWELWSRPACSSASGSDPMEPLKECPIACPVEPWPLIDSIGQFWMLPASFSPVLTVVGL